MDNIIKLKLCIIYNGAAHYRAGIFRLLDEAFDCEWFFGHGYGGIKQLPTSFFKRAHYQEYKNIIGLVSFQKGTIGKLLSRKYDLFLVLGDIPNLAVWIGTFLHNIFNNKRKVYFWSHGMLRVRSYPRQFFEDLFFKLPYANFVYGDRAKEIMISRGFHAERVFSVHNSLDYDAQLAFRGHFSSIYKDHFGNDNPVLFFIGRLTKIKKLDMLIAAVGLIRSKGKTINLVFIGDGEVKEELQKQMYEAKLEDYVWFYGPCYNEKEKSELIANADICVAPGNIGLTAMDSLMYGTPVITMDNLDMQMPEHEAIQEGVTGSFFHEDSIDDLANCIQCWLNNGLFRDEIRQNCYHEIDTKWNPHFQIEVFKKHLIP